MASAWRSQDGSQQHCRKEVAIRLENWISMLQQLTMGTPQGSPHPQVLYNVYTKEITDLKSNGVRRVLTLANERRAFLHNSQWHPHNSHSCSGATRRSVTLVPRHRVRNHSKQDASRVVYRQQQSSRTINDSSLLQCRSHRTYKQSQIPRDPLRQNADVQDAGGINKTQVQERTVRVESHGFKRHRTSSVPAVSECDTQCHWLSSGSHNPVTVQPAEARRGAKRSF